MEHVQSICLMRDLARALAQLEGDLEEAFGLTLNGAMVLCAIGEDCVTASFVSEQTGCRPPLTSKVLNALEGKELLTRSLGKEDRRQVLVSLTPQGKEILARLKEHKFNLPQLPF